MNVLSHLQSEILLMTSIRHPTKRCLVLEIVAAHTQFMIMMISMFAAANVWAQEKAAMENDAAPVARRNLFGELVGQPDDQKQLAGGAILMQRVEGLIERTSELSTRHENTLDHFSKAKQMLAQKNSDLATLPKEYEALALKVVNAEIRQQQLREAGVISLPINHPQVIQFKRDQLQIQQWQAEGAVMQQQSKLLPNEIRNLSNELVVLNQTLQANTTQFLELIAAWDEITSALRWISPQDANEVADRCAVYLERYPKSNLVRIMLGYSRLHLQQPDSASQSFGQVLVEPLANADMISRSLHFKCHLGLLWTALQQKNSDAAGRQVALASKFDTRNYELAIAKAELLRLRGQHANAFDQYRRAVAISPKRTDSYWRAADLVLQTSVRPVEIALQLAKKAAELDESNDWRIALTLAIAYLRSDQSSLFEKQIAKVRSDAPAAALASIDEQVSQYQQLTSNDQ